MHVRCPHCHNPIELVVDDSLHDVTCPSCNSRFSLIADTVDFTPTGGGAGGESRGQGTIAQFELEERLGAGAFGTVWKARDTQLQRTVAVKIPRRSQLSSAELEQFFREARAAAQVNHPNIVSVHEVGRQEDLVYIVSDFVEGQNLADWIAGRSMASRDAARLCRKIALALEAAHQAGIVHRDLKPANVMIDADGEPHVMDFGLAKRHSAEITMTLEGNILGTPAYMSPEQAEGQAHVADARSDVYSLGVMLYEMLTGELPFRGNVRMLLEQVIHDPPPSPRRMEATIPRDLETICLKCLEKDPARRFPSAAALAEELERFVDGKPILARPVNGLERGWRWCLRHRAVSSLLALAFVSMLVGTVVSTYYAGVSSFYASEERKRAGEATTASLLATEKARAARLRYYAASVNLAQEALDDGYTERALELLESQIPEEGEDDLRGFEWYYLWRACHNELKILRGHGDEVLAVAYSPDGLQMASAGADHSIIVWNLADGRSLLTLEGHAEKINALVFSADNRWLFSAGNDASVKLWEVATGREVHSFNHHLGGAKAVDVSSDGKLLFVGTASEQTIGQVKVWDLAERKELTTLAAHRRGNPGHPWGVKGLDVSPDGKRLAEIGYDGQLVLWEIGTWKRLARVRGHAGWGHGIAFSGDGKQIASCSYDGTVKLWSGESLELQRTLGGGADIVFGVAFSPDSRQVAMASMNGAVLWDLESNQTRGVGHLGQVQAIAFSPSGKTLVTGGEDQTVRLWDARARQDYLALQGHTQHVQSVVAMPDGKRVASASRDGTVRIWDLETRATRVVLAGNSGPRNTLEISQDGKRLLSAGKDGAVRIWDVEKSTELVTLQDPKHRAISAVFLPNEKTIVSGTRESLVTWDVASGKATHVHPTSTPMSSLDVSPDGRFYAGSYSNYYVSLASGQFVLMDVESGPLMTSEDDYGVADVAFSPDSKRLALACADRTARVIDIEKRQIVVELTGHTDALTSVAFSPDGRTIATGCQDRTIKLWSVANGQELLTLRGHELAVMDVAFSADGQLLASCDGEVVATATDGAVLIWRAGARDDIRGSTDQRKRHRDWNQRLGRYLVSLQNVEFDATLARKFVAVRRQMAEELQEEPGHAGRLAFSLYELGQVLDIEGQNQEAVEALNEAIEWLDRELERQPDSAIQRSRRVDVVRLLGAVLLKDGKGDGLPHLREALRDAEQLHADFPTTPDFGVLLSNTLSNVAQHVSAEESRKLLEQAVAVQRQVVAANPAHTQYALRSLELRAALLQALAETTDRATLLSQLDTLQAETGEQAIHSYHAARITMRTADVLRSQANTADSPVVKQLGDQAQQLLERAVELGFEDGKWMASDPELKSLHARKDFQKLAASIQPAAPPLIASSLVLDPLPQADLETWSVEPRGHRGAVLAVAVEPGGTRFATAGDDGLVRVWDRQTGALLQAFAAHEEVIGTLAWSPDGKRLASGSYDNKGRIWDLQRATMLHEFALHTSDVNAIAFSPDAKHVATGGDRTLRIWNATSGKLNRTLSLPETTILRLAWSPDSSRVVAASVDNMLRVWSVADGALLHTLSGHQGRIVGLAWSPDGKTIASCGYDKRLHLWSAEDGRLKQAVDEMKQSLYSVQWSPDGQTLAVGGYGFWLVDPEGNDDPVHMNVRKPASDVQWLDDDTLAVGFTNGDWQVHPKGSVEPLVRQVAASQGLFAVAWSPDGTHLACGGESSDVLVWDVVQRKLVSTWSGHRGRITSVAWSPDGKSLVTTSTDRTARLWKMPDGGEPLVLQAHAHHVFDARWFPDGSRLLTCGRDGKIVIWDPEKGEPVNELQGGESSVHAVAISPDGKRLASADDQGNIRVWQLPRGEGKTVIKLQGTVARSLAWSGDGQQLAVGATDALVHIYSTADWKEVESLRGTGSWVLSLDWHPKSGRLASGGSGASLFLRDTYELESVLDKRRGAANRIAWSPDGTSLASANGDGTLRLWEPRSKRCTATLLRINKAHGIHLGPRGDLQIPTDLEDQFIVIGRQGKRQQMIPWTEFRKP